MFHREEAKGMNRVGGTYPAQAPYTQMGALQELAPCSRRAPVLLNGACPGKMLLKAFQR